MDDSYPSDANHAAQKQAAYLASGALQGRPAYTAPGYGGHGPVNLSKDMPLMAQLSESASGHIQMLEVIGKTLMEAHQRVFGPIPPSPEGSNGAAVPQQDTAEAHLLGAQRGITDRLYALQHVANCIANRL